MKAYSIMVRAKLKKVNEEIAVKMLLLICLFFYSSALLARTVDDLKRSLTDADSLIVGFDVDDTVLFSSPSFYYYRGKYNCLDFHNCFNNQDFWFDINNKGDQYSLPKKIAFDLIQFHRSRGDKIYFITARKETPSENLTKIIRQAFDFPDAEKVVFVGDLKKDLVLSKYKISIYYGDADEDILSAKRAGARPVRILRAQNSIITTPYNPGMFQEEVLVGSDF